MNKIKKYIPEILSILIPILIILLACKFTNLYPFGEFSFSKYDGLYQYAGFTMNFKEVLLGKNSLFYSFGASLGYNFYATSIYYLFNPTNLLCIFFNQENIFDYYLFIVLLRIGLSSFTMCKYLKYKFKNQSNIFYVAFSVCYALMGYNVAYYYNYMYFDNVVFFPLLIMGLDKLIYERKNKQYIFMLTISILSNFYIGYMECIFSLLYFIYSYINLKKKDKKIIKDFIISSLLSGIMCAITLIPIVLELLNGKVEHFDIEAQTNYLQFNKNYLNFFYKLMPGTIIEEDIKYGSVNIYVSMLVAVLVIKFFFIKNISKKEKITTLIFILFFLLSLSFNLIDYTWHMFQRPIWYPNRYSFMISFLLITTGCKSYTNLDKIKQSNLMKFIVSILFIGLTIYPMSKISSTESRVKISAFIFGILLLFQYMFLLENKKAKILLFSMLFLELTFNTLITFDNLECFYPIKGLNESIKEYNTLIQKINKEDKKEDNFYRMHIDRVALHNAGSFYKYNGINSFNSIKNSKLIHFFKEQLDYQTTDNTTIIFDGNNPYINSLLGIKYINGIDNEEYYDKYIKHSDSLVIYKNNDALSLGYMVNKNIKNYINKNNNHENTQEIVNLMTNKNYKTYDLLNDNITYHNTKLITKDETEYIENNNIKDNSITIKGIIKKDGFLTLNKDKDFYVDVELYINDKKDINLGRNKLPTILKKNDKYKLVFKSNKDSYKKEYIDAYITYIDEYKEVINDLKTNQLEITKYKKDNYIKGIINVDKDKTTLFTTIPYNKGWNIYVDNKKINYSICTESFICLDLSQGNHTIEFKFIPKGFIIGSIISLITLITTIIYTRKK